jgi:AcrR family transcriptional regulator
MSTRRTQAERRAETQSLVLESACQLFGEKGYADTSVADIAKDCGLTTRPIYHYYGNKLALFKAVTEAMSLQLMEKLNPMLELSEESMLYNWRAFMDYCDDPHFRQIVLIDTPKILGRIEWQASPSVVAAHDMILQQADGSEADQFRLELLSRMIISALTEAALLIAETDNIEMARQEAERLATQIIKQIPPVVK